MAGILAVLLSLGWLVSGSSAALSSEAASEVDGAVSYRYVMFDPTQLRDTDHGEANGVQLSVFEVLADGVPVPAIQAWPLIDDWKTHERAELLIDGQVTTKWFSPSRTDNAVVIDLGNPTAIDGYRWATANDVPARDPVSWRVLGSNDGETFALLDTREDHKVPTERYTMLSDLTFDSPDEDTTTTTTTSQTQEQTDPQDDPNHSDQPTTINASADGRFLVSDAELAGFRSAMAGEGPFYAPGDAPHGGVHSPGDGRRSERLAADFLGNPSASYWSQPGLPYSPGDAWPRGIAFARPMHAAWVYMTQPDRSDRDQLRHELVRYVLKHAKDPSLDFSDASKYPIDFHGAALNPIFEHAQWMTRVMKTRDLLGREALTAPENEMVDQWLYGYANWSAKWFDHEVYGKHLPGRYERDYTVVPAEWSSGSARPYDGGPNMANGSRAYTNRHAAVASAMSLAANYVAHFDHNGTLRSRPSYGVYSVDETLEHSRLFVEETLRFSVFPEGVQGDFERGDAARHKSSPQQGWLYSINVLSNLVEIADYHARRGDLSVWEYETTAGLAGSEGAPVAGGFRAKNLHFYAWSMSRFVNGEWGRTNRDEPLALPHFYHDVIPAAAVHRRVGDDALLEAAWRRDGRGFPSYPESPQSQGPWPAHLGEGGKKIGLIEVAVGASPDTAQ